MTSECPPWKRPAVIRAAGGGSPTYGALANHWKRWDAKPEAYAPEGPFDAMLVRLQLANRRKRRDSKARG